MAPGAQQEKNVEDAMENLKIDPSSKASSTFMPGPKDGSASDATSCISSVDASGSSVKESEADQEALIADQGTYGYYYPVFNGPSGEWDEQYYVLGADGSEIQHPAIQPSDGSVSYYIPGFQHGYVPYGTFAPGPIIGVDGQYLGQQPYYSSPIFQQTLVSPGYFPQSAAYGPELVPMYQWDSTPLFVTGFQGNAFIDSANPSPKHSLSSQNHKVTPSKSLSSSKSAMLEKRGSAPAFDTSSTPVVNNQSVKLMSEPAAAVSKGYLPTSKFPFYPNQGKGGLFYQNSINLKEIGCTWVGTEKLKARNKVHGVGGNLNLLDERNCGPRTNGMNNIQTSAVDQVEGLGAEGNYKAIASIPAVMQDCYNLPNFLTKYDHAWFFVIKSYSEDDIHKSIKYNVWASTPNGNKRLDNAFQVAQDKMVEAGSKCPVFLFFSVNASGQFCGVAEMIGRVDFTKNLDFWQQDKWNGFFPVKWHIIKDVRNPQFRHIILENNENKPVTNSRDTQEVKFPQGTEMLNIFKSYSSKTSILDDFAFYENRQKVMQDKKMKPPLPRVEYLLPKPDGMVEVTKQDDAEHVGSSPLLMKSAMNDDAEAEELPSGCSVKG